MSVEEEVAVDSRALVHFFVGNAGDGGVVVAAPASFPVGGKHVELAV